MAAGGRSGWRAEQSKMVGGKGRRSGSASAQTRRSAHVRAPWTIAGPERCGSTCTAGNGDGGAVLAVR